MEKSKLHQEQGQHHAEETGSVETSSTFKEFATAEELLRHDREETVVPSTIATRLNDSVASEKQPEASWWKKLFGKKG